MKTRAVAYRLDRGTTPAILGLVLLGAAAAGAVDLGVWKGCAASDADFARTTLIPNGQASGAVKMDFDLMANNVVDIYFIEKSGNFKKYDGVAKATTTLGRMPAATGNEDGLVGLALDPNFKTNRTVFFFYSFNGAGESTYRISRLKLGADGKLDMASEKVLIKIPSVRNKWHTAGAMDFDSFGDLYIAVGDNEATEPGPGNTADLRGGILRIHPDESDRGYSIPPGNFSEVIAARFRTAGNTTLADQYADPAKVKPEIYVKGTRNAYSLTVDPYRRGWVSWGDVGPDQGQMSEEHNLVKEPYYTGWPYFAGDQNLGNVSPYGTAIPAGAQKSGPVNNLAGLMGVKTLPPVRDPIFRRRQGCAMTGPIFHYDNKGTSASQFPPQFDHKWMVSGCDGHGFHLMSYNADLSATTADLKIFGSFATNTLVDLKQGPDGALYYVNYGSGIDVIRYTGTCKDPDFPTEQAPTVSVFARAMEAHWLQADGRSLSVSAQGPHSIDVLDVQGRIVASFSGEGMKSYSLDRIRSTGVYHVKARGPLGLAYRKLVLSGF